MTEFVTPQLRTVLKTFQDSATKSLQGPGLALVHPHKKELLSPEINDESIIHPSQLPPPEMPQPILSAADTGRGVLYETFLEGKPIGCLLLGGEMRLCLPQFLNNVLPDFTLDQINRIFDELRIYCSQCTPEQLNEFKAANILPEDVKASGLITRTNAERLCSALLHRSDRRRNIQGAITFKVYHKCFGKCVGICAPDLYTYKEPSCIECIECHGMFSPQKFVCHVHKQQENRTCHWGFDSSNWRAYLHVTLDEDKHEKYTNMLDDLREREQHELFSLMHNHHQLHQQQQQQHQHCNLKRKAMLEELPLPTTSLCKGLESSDIPLKKPKLMEESFMEYHQYQQALILAHIQHQQMSAFRPWAHIGEKFIAQHVVGQGVFTPKNIPYIQEPPVLQNPERVVRLSECERFERSFQPNVALAPLRNSNTVLMKERDRDRERENCDFHIKDAMLTTDVSIKQERMDSPVDVDVIMSPHLRDESPLQVIKETNISSPDALSGSNEITSSTSPLPINQKLQMDVIAPPPIETINIQDNLHIRAQHPESPDVVVLQNGVTAIVGNPEFELSTDTDDDSLTGEPDSSNGSAPWDIASEILKDSRPEVKDKVLHLIKMLVHENARLEQYSVENARLLQELRRKDDQIAELQQLNQEHLMHHHQHNNHRHHMKRIVLQASVPATTIVANVAANNNYNNIIPSNEMNGCVIPNQETIHTHERVRYISETSETTNGSISPPIYKLMKTHQQPLGLSKVANTTEVIMKPLKKSIRRSPEKQQSQATSVVVNVIQPSKHMQQESNEEMMPTKVSVVSSKSHSPCLSLAEGQLSPIKIDHQQHRQQDL